MDRERDQRFWSIFGDVLADVEEDLSSLSIEERQQVERALALAIVTAMQAGENDPHRLRRYGKYLARRKLQRVNKRRPIPN